MIKRCRRHSLQSKKIRENADLLQQNDTRGWQLVFLIKLYTVNNEILQTSTFDTIQVAPKREPLV